MLDTIKITQQLAGQVGLYAGFSGGSFLPAAYHRAPKVYLSDAHKLLRPDVLSALGPNLADIALHPKAYDAQTVYQRYDLCRQGETVYESLIANNSAQLLTDATKWRKTTLLSAWYGRIERGAIAKVLLNLAMNPAVKPLMDRQPLFNGEANIQGVINKQNRFLGIRIAVRGATTALTIAKGGLQLTAPVADLPVYLFHSESAEPLATARLTGTTAGRTIWSDLNETLFERDSGYYLLGYFEADLPDGIHAVGSERGFGVGQCSSCSPDYVYAAARSPYVQIQPVYVHAVTPGQMTWADENEVSLQTWGLNLIIEARCNVTQTVLDHEDMLLNSLLYTIACDVLEEISTSYRVNAIAKEARMQAYSALYGEGKSKTDNGLASQRDQIAADLKKVFAQISPDCLPKEAPRRGIRFDSFW